MSFSCKNNTHGQRQCYRFASPGPCSNGDTAGRSTQVTTEANPPPRGGGSLALLWEAAGVHVHLCCRGSSEGAGSSLGPLQAAKGSRHLHHPRSVLTVQLTLGQGVDVEEVTEAKRGPFDQTE